MEFNDILKAITEAVDNFDATLPAAQKSVLSALQLRLKDLDLTKTGDIKTSVANLKKIGRIKQDLQNIVVTDKYLNNVQIYVDAFATVTTLQNAYWAQIEDTFKPTALLGEITKQAVTDTVTALTENGVGATISGEISDVLNSNITTGGSYADLTDQLRELILGKPAEEGAPATPGNLSKYARQITTDAINQYSAQYTKAVTDDLGFEWFAYQGSDITTTRPFCFAMTDFTFFHVSEIPRLLRAEDLYWENPKTGKRELVPIYDKTGLPQGMYPNTNVNNFQILRGGYNCGHQIRPVSGIIVPPDIKDRVKNTAAYKVYKSLKK